MGACAPYSYRSALLSPYPVLCSGRSKSLPCPSIARHLAVTGLLVQRTGMPSSLGLSRSGRNSAPAAGDCDQEAETITARFIVFGACIITNAWLCVAPALDMSSSYASRKSTDLRVHGMGLQIIVKARFFCSNLLPEFVSLTARRDSYVREVTVNGQRYCIDWGCMKGFGRPFHS